MTEKVKRKSMDDVKGTNAKKTKIENEGTETKSEKPFKTKKKPFNAKDGNKKPLFGKKVFKKGAGGSKPPVQTEKTNWNEFKAQKKELKEKRKRQKVKDLYELSVQAKQLYEKVKCKATPNKHELCKQLHELLKSQNSYEKLVFSHDITRVVQCLLKYSTAEIKKDICDLLVPHIPAMAMSKYAHFCVLRMLKYGTKPARSNLIKAFYGHVVKLATHNFSNGIIDVAYNMHASDEERIQLRQEFYTDMYKNDKDLKLEKLSDTWKNSPEMKNAILSRTKANLQKCANKELLDNSLVHVVLLDYLNECTETDRTEMIQTLIPFVAHLASTKEGTQAAIQCFLQSVTKDRRALLKGIKEYIEKICNAEFGHLFMITIINCTDDTVILGKLVLSVILGSIEQIAGNEWGRKVLEWIVAPEDRAFSHPKLIEEMNAGLKFSKKDANIRRAEILANVETELSNKVAGNPSFWLRSGAIGLLTAAILKVLKGDNLKKVYDALATVICDPEWKVLEVDTEAQEKPDQENPALKISAKKLKKNPLEDEKKESDKQVMIAGIEHPGLHIALKKMIKNDKEKVANGEASFTQAIIEHLDEYTIKKWIELNRACFILVNVFENTTQDNKDVLKSKLSRKLVEKQSHMGSKILLKKLKE